MASMVVVQHKQPSSTILSSSLSDFNGARLTASVQPKGALRVTASSSKKILIMGGTRFIGLFLSRLLVKEGHQVTLFTRGKAPIAQQLPGEPDSEFSDFASKILHLKGDRKDFDFVKSSLSAEGFDVVYDINGREADEVEPILDALPNLEQYIYCSSAGVYLKSDYLPHFETDAVDPKSRHKGKLETESLLASRDVNWTSIRPVYIYGPLNYNPVEEWFFHRLKAGRPIPIPNSGMQVTQLGHVKDLATAFIKVLGNEKASKEVFNISGEKYVTFDGLAKACAKAGGFPEPEIIHYNPKEFDFGKKKPFPFRDQVNKLALNLINEAQNGMLIDSLSDDHYVSIVYDECSISLPRLRRQRVCSRLKPEFDLVEGLTDSYNLDFGRGTFRKEADFSTDDIILGKSLVLQS
ncbi:hypothetical protein DH2020_024183 [Rehmannia glutinosa]|uniref:NAD-dependent epimerase/dehydratase domain-containing protein n=1 Tax=Rehmannia glutinosa TaxID=99300 RepID=A0ABR0WCJ2_REHGL